MTFVVNPVAGNHKAARQWAGLQKELADKSKNISVEFTTHKKHATEITRRALENGGGCIIAVGGDGTLNEVVNGFMSGRKIINREAKLGLIPLGTGCDFARTTRTAATIENAVALLPARQTRQCDLGVMTYRDHKGKISTRYFVNVADAGFGGEVAKTVNNSSKRMGHFFTYFFGLLRALATYKNKTVRLCIDDKIDEQVTINSIVVANGRYFGGGMRVAPDADIGDGLFDVIVIGDLTKWEAVTNIPKLYNGTLCDHKKVTHYRGKKITLASEETVLLEADGETPGMLPVTFEIIPGAIRFIG